MTKKKAIALVFSAAIGLAALDAHATRTANTNGVTCEVWDCGTLVASVVCQGTSVVSCCGWQGDSYCATCGHRPGTGLEK